MTSRGYQVGEKWRGLMAADIVGSGFTGSESTIYFNAGEEVDVNEITLAIVVALVGFSPIIIIAWLLDRARKQRRERTPDEKYKRMVMELRIWGVLIILRFISYTLRIWVRTGGINWITIVGTLLLIWLIIGLFFSVKDAAVFAMYGTLLGGVTIVDTLWFFLLARELMPPEQHIFGLELLVERLILMTYFFIQFARHRKNQLAYVRQVFGEDNDRKTVEPLAVDGFIGIGLLASLFAMGLQLIESFLLVKGNWRLFFAAYDYIVRFSLIGIGVAVASWLSGFPDRKKWIRPGIFSGAILFSLVFTFVTTTNRYHMSETANPSAQLSPTAIQFPNSQAATSIPSTPHTPTARSGPTYIPGLFSTPLLSTMTNTSSPTPLPPTPANTLGPTLELVEIPYTQLYQTDENGLKYSLDSSGGDVIFGKYESPTAYYTGAVYIYGLNPDGTWNSGIELMPPDKFSVTEFGAEVAIDGDLAIASAKYDQNVIGKDALKYLIFNKVNGSWQYLTQFEMPWEYQRPSLDMSEGYIVAGDKNRSYEAPDGSIRHGAVEIFRRQGNEWVSDAILYPPEEVFGDNSQLDLGFGINVAIDGDTLAISSVNVPGVPFGIGGVFIYRRNPAGEWTLQNYQVFENSDYILNRAYDLLILKDKTLIIGDSSNPDDRYGNSVIIIDDLSEAGDWSDLSVTELKPEYPYAFFGNNIAFDGQSLVITSSSKYYSIAEHLEDFELGIDALHVYRRDQANPLSWTLSNTLKLSNPEPSVGAFFPPMALSDNILVFVGAAVGDDSRTRIFYPGSLNAVELPVE